MNRTSAPGLVLACMVIAASLPPSTAAQSFDCRKATTDVEKMICVDKTLSKLDEELAQAFAAARTRIAPIVIGQPAWLRVVRNRCQDVECLTRAYYSRVSYLRELKPAPAFPLAGITGEWTRVGSTRQHESRLTVEGVTATGFIFRFFAMLGDRMGELEGAAATRGGSVFYRDEEDTSCQVTFTKNGARLRVATSPECSTFAGMGVTFEGEYGQGEPLVGPPPLSVSGVLAQGVPESAFRTLVGKDYELFQNSMERLGDAEDLDGLRMKVVHGFMLLPGGFREGEAIVMSRSDGTILAAVVDDLLIKYYSTDSKLARTLPKTIERWRTTTEGLASLKIVYASAR